MLRLPGFQTQLKRKTAEQKSYYSVDIDIELTTTLVRARAGQDELLHPNTTPTLAR